MLTLSVSEGRRVQKHIESAQTLGLDECVVIEPNMGRFDTLIQELLCTQFVLAMPVTPVEGRILES